MIKTLWATLIVVILTAGQAFALEITSLAPNRGTPGTLVAINGGLFSPQTQPFLGEHYVIPRIVNENYMEFTVPYLPPGDYLLTVQDGNRVTDQSFKFEVLSPTPQISGLNPRTLDICTVDSQLQIEINGRNFLSGAVILINSNAVPSRVINSTTLEAQLPEFQEAGIYGVSVRNPDGATSLPHSLLVNNLPEIYNVERGADFVTYYEVIIHGKNFLFNSTLVLHEQGSSPLGPIFQQLSFIPRNNTAPEGDGKTIAPQRDQLIYVDCRTLIYQRHPASFQNKELGLQVFNPNGGNTGLHYVVLP